MNVCSHRRHSQVSEELFKEDGDVFRDTHSLLKLLHSEPNSAAAAGRRCQLLPLGDSVMGRGQFACLRVMHRGTSELAHHHITLHRQRQRERETVTGRTGH